MKTPQRTPKRIALTWHPSLMEAQLEAHTISKELQARGIDLVGSYSLHDKDFSKQLEELEFDLVIALGGDGTMLRTGKICAPLGIPIWGINMGNLGFLIETKRDDWRNSLDNLLSLNWRCEERMLLHVTILRENKPIGEWEVLNEAVVTRGTSMHPIRINVNVGSSYLTEFVADGLIVASATGSTAYAMAAGGPILQPELRNLLIVPVAPHLCLGKSLVLQEGEIVEITVSSYQSALFSPDGAEGIEIYEGDKVIVSASDNTALFVRFHDIGFFYNSFLKYVGGIPNRKGKKNE